MGDYFGDLSVVTLKLLEELNYSFDKKNVLS